MHLFSNFVSVLKNELMSLPPFYEYHGKSTQCYDQRVPISLFVCIVYTGELYCMLQNTDTVTREKTQKEASTMRRHEQQVKVNADDEAHPLQPFGSLGQLRCRYYVMKDPSKHSSGNPQFVNQKKCGDSR